MTHICTPQICCENVESSFQLIVNALRESGPGRGSGSQRARNIDELLCDCSMLGSFFAKLALVFFFFMSRKC